MAGDNITEIMGIVNGTTNYILTKMSEKGMGYEDALRQATELGYAESDPTADVEGYDAGRKIAIMASLAFHSRVTFSQVYTEGITEDHSRRYPLCERIRLCNQASWRSQTWRRWNRGKSTSHADQ